MISKHMIHHDNNEQLLLVYNKVNAAVVETYLRRRLGRLPAYDTVLRFNDAIGGLAVQTNRCLVRTSREYDNTYGIAV